MGILLRSSFKGNQASPLLRIRLLGAHVQIFHKTLRRIIFQKSVLYKGLIHYLPAKLVPIGQAPRQELRPAHHKRCGCQELFERVCGIN